MQCLDLSVPKLMATSPPTATDRVLQQTKPTLTKKKQTNANSFIISVHFVASPGF